MELFARGRPSNLLFLPSFIAAAAILGGLGAAVLGRGANRWTYR
jgi:hypothetical protein